MESETQQESAVERAHRLLIERILTGVYPPGTELPGERPLSKDLGVARNALREALQRLAHDGWVDISQGRATRVLDYLRNGNLNILIDLLHTDHRQPLAFVPDMLHMWALVAQDYTEKAVEQEAVRIAERLELYASLADSPQACAQAMWQLHRTLIDYCGNVVYGLIFNSFAAFYNRLAIMYYQIPEKRERARQLWQTLHDKTQQTASTEAAALLAAYIREDIPYWQSLTVISDKTDNRESDE